MCTHTASDWRRIRCIRARAHSAMPPAHAPQPRDGRCAAGAMQRRRASRHANPGRQAEPCQNVLAACCSYHSRRWSLHAICSCATPSSPRTFLTTLPTTRALQSWPEAARATERAMIHQLQCLLRARRPPAYVGRSNIKQQERQHEAPTAASQSSRSRQRGPGRCAARVTACPALAPSPRSSWPGRGW